jgi:hypothetical protein
VVPDVSKDRRPLIWKGQAVQESPKFVCHIEADQNTYKHWREDLKSLTKKKKQLQYSRFTYEDSKLICVIRNANCSWYIW